MSDESLELGSKISLVSNAGIRYEGRLFTVDPDQCTIALSGVRSFGTEDRDVPRKVPPQNNVYDYILFRGSDIRDIFVINSVPYPHDPAIMQLSAPPSLSQKPFQAGGFSQTMGHFGPHMSQFPPTAYGGMSTMPTCLAPGMSTLGRESSGFPKPSELTMPGPIPPPDLSAVEQPRSGENDMLAARSRSTTPASLISGKSSTNDQGVQVSGLNKRDDKKIMQPIQPPGQRNQQHRDRRDSRGDGQQQQQQQRNQVRPMRYPNNNQQGNQPQRQGGWVQRGQMRQRGRPRSAGYRQHPNFQQNQNGTKPKIKFDQEYDFEQANSEFEVLINQLAKTKIEEVKPEVNGDTDKKDDSGNETGAGEGEPEEDPQAEVYYDKAKSFFDNISCEAVEHQKGRSQRTDWRTERKLNSETFGVSAARRGNYRGRGSYRGMGYRGGYRRGYHHNQGQNQNRDAAPRPSDVQNTQQNAQGSSNCLAKQVETVGTPVVVKK